MSSTQTIETYVSEITLKIMDADYLYLDNLYETLQKMKGSSKQKHEDNYWKVLQCLGETTSDAMVKALVRCELGSCKYHINRNLFVLASVFMDMLTSVAAIKHINLYKDKVVPVLFKMLRQREILELSRTGFACLYRCLLFGKFSFVEIYLRHNIFRDIQECIKCRLSFYSMPTLEAIEYCIKMLLAMAVLGGTNTQRRMKSSQALKVLMEYIKILKLNNQMEKNLILSCRKSVLCFQCDSLIEILYGETEENLKDTWDPKDKLNEELADEVHYFCSCPSCRKPYSEKEKFLYCGACKLSRYCSEKCQKEHWKNGHKLVCLKEQLKDSDFQFKTLKTIESQTK